jgi:radical SAM superfamily enzyme YgiQ (UPF0313 family)
MVIHMKLGLIAISGVRVCDEELLRVGLTLPGFVRRSEIIASLPSLGLLTLAAMTPADIDVDYLEVPDVGADNGLCDDYDAVAISSYTAQIKDAYRLADRYRKSGTAVILGGLHVTSMPGEALKHSDAIVIGEGEPSWPKVLDDLRRDALRPVYDSRGDDFNLNESPVPRYELLDRDRYNRLTVQTQRGCPHRCEFCAASLQLCPGYKVKPVDNVIREIRRIKEIWPKPFIEFADDNTFVNKAHSKKLMRAVANEHVRWFTETDITVAEDDELLGLMRDSGCAQVLIGLESTSRSALDLLETRANWKVRQLDGYRGAIEKIQGYGISVNGCFILGLDGSTVESFNDVYDFARDSGLHEVQVTIQTPFPGTPLYDRLRKTGRLLDEKAWELCTLFDVNFQPERMTVDELKDGFRDLIARLYSDDLVTKRKKAFRERLRVIGRRKRRKKKE